MRPRHLLLRFLLPMVWKLSPSRKLRSILEFSQTELDSAWQSLYALEMTNNPKTRASLFNHALEEFYHADLFRTLHDSLSSKPADLPVITREAVLQGKSKNDFLKFIAFFYVGEREVNADFAVYQKGNIDPKVKELFAKILADEAGHEKSSLDLLMKLGVGSKWKARWLLLEASCSRMFKQYSALMTEVGKIPLIAILSLLYFLFGWMGKQAAAARLTMNYHEQLEIALAQKKSYEAQSFGNTDGSQS